MKRAELLPTLRGHESAQDAAHMEMTVKQPSPEAIATAAGQIKHEIEIAPMSLTPESVSLIVPVYNGGENFARCLRGIHTLAPRPGEVIVVDDGSSDGSGAVAQDSGAHVLQTARPRSGPAIARNLAASQVNGTILFFADADVLLPSDAIARVVDGFRTNPHVAALYGSYDDAPHAQNFVSQYKNLLHHFVHQDSSGQATSFWAGCGAILRDAFEQSGGFSDSFRRPSIEDIELGYRLKKLGYQTKLVKSLQVKHLKQWTIGSLLESDVRDRALPWTALILRDRQFPADLNLKWSHRLSVALVYLTLVSLVIVPLSGIGLLLAGLCLTALIAMNRHLYRFFAAKRSWRFMLAAIPMHFFFYAYSGFAFGFGLVRWLVTRHSVTT
jgi:glycosyltransferase involved in cell wall biosynthesis